MVKIYLGRPPLNIENWIKNHFNNNPYDNPYDNSNARALWLRGKYRGGLNIGMLDTPNVSWVMLDKPNESWLTIRSGMTISTNAYEFKVYDDDKKYDSGWVSEYTFPNLASTGNWNIEFYA